MAPTGINQAQFLNASAELYREWLQQQSAWSEFWMQGCPQAPVVLTSWQGHRNWWLPPEESVRQPAPQKTKMSMTSPEAGWGAIHPNHVALLVHGFHLPLLREILIHVPDAGGADGLPCLDLYLTVPHDRFDGAIQVLKQLGWPRARVFAVVNRGRDLAPFLLQALPAALAEGHHNFVKLHTKTSSHLNEGKPWREHLLDNLFRPTFLAHLDSYLAENEHLGLIAPSGTVLPCTVSLGKNASHLLQLCKLYSIPPRSLLASRFIAGTMMAGRLEALRPLLKADLNLEAFEAEAGQTDGTLAHALERWIAVMAQAQGWQIQELEGCADAVPKFGYGWATDP